jgi:hypothetical protein
MFAPEDNAAYALCEKTWLDGTNETYFDGGMEADAFGTVRLFTSGMMKFICVPGQHTNVFKAHVESEGIVMPPDTSAGNISDVML